MRPLITSFFCIVFYLQVGAQIPYAIIDQITVEGNSKTKTSVVLRELLVQQGDTIQLAELADALEKSEMLLMNTTLFSSVNIGYQNWAAENNRIHLKVQVNETWYIYPIPSFRLADRNFNVWWVEHNASLARTNIGMDFTHLNTTGRGDRLKLSFQLGYTQNYRLRYNTRALNKKQTLGLTARVAYAQNREVNYATVENRQVFFNNNEEILYHRFQGDLSFNLRPKIWENHELRLGFRQNRVSEQITKALNPDFFLGGRNFQRYAILEYVYSKDRRDVRAYPIRGFYTSFAVEKDGLGFFNDRNALTTQFEYHFYQPLLPKVYFGAISKFKYSLIREQQPYNDNRAIGFSGNSLRGYEYYIIDGLDMVLLNTHFKIPIFSSKIQLGKMMPIKAFRRIPIRANLSLNNDFGVVNNPFEKAVNPFNNRLLWGTGLGLDTIFFFDFVLRIEYSRNHLGETGVFIHFNSSI